VTGLLLAALSLRHRDETNDLSLDVPGHSPYLQDYLAAEVLAHLPLARRDWLVLAELTVRAHLSHVLGKVYLANRTRSVLPASKKGWPGKMTSP
jgi:ATP/maltotriose-dependent transcriptional regulator MalT